MDLKSNVNKIEDRHSLRNDSEGYPGWLYIVQKVERVEDESFRNV